jgi:hypothetical protein
MSREEVDHNSPLTLPRPTQYAAETIEGSHEIALVEAQDNAIVEAELDQLRSQVMRARGGQKLRLILDSPSPQALIQRMPPQELLLTIQDIGKSDCAELIEVATKEQITVCLDLDCWRKDRLLIEQVDDWLGYLAAGELLAAEKILEGLDVETLVYYCIDLFHIYYRVDEDWPSDPIGDIIEMPDTFYIVHVPFPPEDKRSTLAHGLLHLFTQYGYEFYHRMFEWLRWGQKTDLEEIAYQFRKGRIEDFGFIDYYEAIAIYQPLPFKAEAPAVSRSPLQDERLPVISAPRRDGLFGAAYKGLPEDETQRVERELLYLTNKVMCADLVEPGHLQAMQQSMRTVQRTIDLGLELLGGREPEEGTSILRQFPIEWIFRKGFSELAKLRKQGTRIAREKRLTLQERFPLSLLPSPYIQVMQAVRQLKPRYHSAIDAAPGAPRPFRNLEDIQRTRQALDTAALLAPLFFDEFGFSHETLSKWLEEDRLLSPAHPEDIHFGHLFLTALAQMTLTGSFVLEPITPEQVKTFLNEIFEPNDEPPHTVKASFQEQIEAELLKRPNTQAADNEQLQQWLSGVWQTLREEAAYLPLPLTEAPDTRFMQLFLVAKES